MSTLWEEGGSVPSGPDSEREIFTEALESNADLSWDLDRWDPWPSPAPQGTLPFGLPASNFSHFHPGTGDRPELAMPSRWDSLALYQDPCWPWCSFLPFRAFSHPLLFCGVDQIPQETWDSCLWGHPHPDLLEHGLEDILASSRVMSYVT